VVASQVQRRQTPRCGWRQSALRSPCDRSGAQDTRAHPAGEHSRIRSVLAPEVCGTDAARCAGVSASALHRLPAERHWHSHQRSDLRVEPPSPSQTARARRQWLRMMLARTRAGLPPLPCSARRRRRCSPAAAGLRQCSTNFPGSITRCDLLRSQLEGPCPLP